jgi:hypothetical protein
VDGLRRCALSEDHEEDREEDREEGRPGSDQGVRRDARAPESVTGLRRESDELLKTIERLRRLENERRDTQISSRRFHDIGREVEAAVRDIFRHTIHEDSRATAVGRQDVTIAAVPEPPVPEPAEPAGDEGGPEEDAEA